MNHKVTLNDAKTNQTVLDSGTFTFNEISEPFVVNDKNSYYYYDANVIEDDPDFVMEGTIDVINQQQPLLLRLYMLVQISQHKLIQ